VLYIYLTKFKGLGVPETMFAGQELLMIFLEIPTGVVADKTIFSVNGICLDGAAVLFLPLTNSYLPYILIFSVKLSGNH
jgi:hypothetical protein